MQKELKLETGKWKYISNKKLLAFILLLVIFSSAFAKFGGGKTHAKARLISEVSTVQPGHSFWVAVRLKMDPHWHIYWRNVGDTGLETTVEWQLPKSVSAGKLKWPYPERIVEEPLVVYGYHGTKYLLTKIKVAPSVKVGTSLKIAAKVSWLVCAEVCVPGDTVVSVELPVKPGPPQINTNLAETFSAARSVLPLTNSDWKLNAAVNNGQLKIQAVAPDWFKGRMKSMVFFPYQQNLIRYAGDQKLKIKGRTYRLTLPLVKNDMTVPDTLKGILVSDEGWRGPRSEKAIEIILPLSEKLASAPGGGQAALQSIWLAILFSFIGGLILNLMPCVLPVLSIKIMGFIKQAHDEKIASWKHGLSFTFGVLAAFWALAGLLLLLKSGGEHLGWGFQLQSPVFLIVVAVFMFLFGLSLLGVFEIGTSFTTVGGASQKLHGLTSSFVSGIIATIVATPCTAPFMGSALGFALTQPNWVAIVVFTFLGLGMATPFFVISSIPALLKYVPKPGRWMESLEQFMGFLLVATVIWLLWVLGLQIGPTALMLVLFDLLFAAFAAWIYGRWGTINMPKKKRLIAWMMALLILIGSNGYVLANIHTYAVTSQQQTVNNEGIRWQPFSEEKLNTLLQQNKPVFIDFTAAWCLSCQVNEQVAFSSEKVQKKFKELGITALQADWTKRDAKIANALAKYGRSSVPLYVLYDGKNAKPHLLPEVITPSIVLEALKAVEKE